jgi:ABC-type sugar transport system permease subunit
VSPLDQAERARAAFLVAPALRLHAGLLPAAVRLHRAMSLWTRTPQGVEATWTLANYADFFARPALRQGLWNSLQIAGTVTVLSVLLAYPLAWFLAMVVPARWQRLALLLAILPFWTSYVVRSYAWFLLLAQNGFLNQGPDRRGPPRDAAGARQHPDRHGHRLRPFLRHAEHADDLREPRAACRRTSRGRRPTSAPRGSRRSCTSSCR